jgi:cytochrome c oxidase assembly protein subunit 15
MRRLFSRLTGPRAFRPLLLIVLVGVFLNIATGALVRVTGSGLGCPDWPLCEGRATPPMNLHGVIEFGNRGFALLVILSAILLAVTAFRNRRRSQPWRWRATLAMAIGLFLQGPLGGLTVLLQLHPLSVMSHFILAVLVLVIAVFLALTEFQIYWNADPPARWVTIGGIVVAIWAWLVIISGAVVTMSGTHPGSEGVPRLWNLLDAAYLHVRIAASFVVIIAIFLLLLSRVAHAPRSVMRLSWILVIVVALQVSIGEVQWRTQLPWWLVLVHVAGGAAVLAVASAFGWVIGTARRPPPDPPPPPLAPPRESAPAP